MNNPTRLLISLSHLERFTNDALRLKHDMVFLNVFHFNHEILKAAVTGTYLETVGNRADLIHLAIKRYSVKDKVKGIRDSLFSRISALSRRSISDNTVPIMIAFDYIHEDFYCDRDSLWMHGWTGEHCVTGKFFYLTASIVNNDLRLPIVSIPSPMGNDMPSEISAVRDIILPLLDHMDLLLFDRGFYSKDLIMSLNERKMNYLIFVPKKQQVKEEFSSMYQTQRKVILHEFSMYKNGRDH